MSENVTIEAKKKELSNYKEFYLHYLNAVAKLCRVAEHESVVRKVQELRSRYSDDQGPQDLSPAEQCTLKLAAYALERYSYDDTDAGTAQAVERLKSDLFARNMIELSLASELKPKIERLFGRDEAEAWLDQREKILTSLTGNDLTELRDTTAARATFFDRYIRENSDDKSAPVFMPSVVEESFRLSTKNLFYSIK